MCVAKDRPYNSWWRYDKDKGQIGDGFNSLKDEGDVNNRSVKKFPLGFHSMTEKEVNLSRKKDVCDKAKNADWCW